ncbi:MAG: hypothetical protein HC796_11950 [Synechococcaceae cyanobacterium RL_1_2]|nr:hypothetical protein [Synechococcaceae cyanobacterium RL_1_2]
MLRTDSADNEVNSSNRKATLDIQRQLDELEELILESSKIIFTKLTIVNEDEILDQLDAIRLNLPKSFEQAMEILHYQEQIITDAENYAQEIIEAAEKRANQILNESGIIQHAEREAELLRQRTERECEQMRLENNEEIDLVRRETQKQLEQFKQDTLDECAEIQQGADMYADQSLGSIEIQLLQMLKIVKNGRKQLQGNKNIPPSNPGKQ